MMKLKKQPPLSPQDIRRLKSELHHLKPIVIIGNNGVTGAVINEINRALDDHELIKIRIHTKDRKELFRITEEVCTKTHSTLIQIIGYVVTIYKKNLQNEIT